jgi:hypothetical protein
VHISSHPTLIWLFIVNPYLSSSNVHLQVEVDDDIIWKFTNNGQYSAASAYQMQFLSLVHSSIDKMIWKAWTPPKTKITLGLLCKSSFWTAHRLEKRGGQIADYALFVSKPRRWSTTFLLIADFTTRIWILLKDWLGIHGIHPRQWSGLPLKEWCSLMAAGASPHR